MHANMFVRTLRKSRPFSQQLGVTWRAVLICLVAMLAIGCSRGPSASGSLTTACTKITNAPLAGVFQQAPDDVTAYLQQEVDPAIKPELETFTPSTNLTYTTTYYQWGNDAVARQVATFDSKLRYANVAFLQEWPALMRAVQCLGSPAFYSLRYVTAADSSPFLTGELFYPEKGMIVYFGPVFGKVDVTGGAATVLHSSVPVKAIRLVAPNNNVKTMDWLAFPYGWQTSEATYIQQNQPYYASVLVWPGTVEEMQLTYIASYLLPDAATSMPIQSTATP